MGSYAFYLVDEIDRAIEVFDRTIELAGGDPSFGADTAVSCPLAYSHVFKGGYLVIKGRIAEGRALIDEGIEIALASGDLETAAWGRMWFTWVGFYTGDVVTATAYASQALDLPERVGQNSSRVWSWTMLGVIELMGRNWARAGEALERAQGIADERRSSVEGRGLRSTWSGEAPLGMGDRAGAERLVREGLEFHRQRGMTGFEALGWLALARIELAAEGSPDADAVRGCLGQVLTAARRNGGRLIEPMVHRELAELARRRGDEMGRERELRTAERLLAEMGAGPRPG